VGFNRALTSQLVSHGALSACQPLERRALGKGDGELRVTNRLLWLAGWIDEVHVVVATESQVGQKRCKSDFPHGRWDGQLQHSTISLLPRDAGLDRIFLRLCRFSLNGGATTLCHVENRANKRRRP